MIKIAQNKLAAAIAKANAADDTFSAAIKSAGYSSRWEWSACSDDKPRAAYIAKIQADEAMHEAFEMLRQIERACA